MRILLMIWIFPVVANARTLVLQPSLNGSVLQNSSLVDEILAEWIFNYQHHPHTEEDELTKWEKEPGTKINVIGKKDNTDTVHSMKMKKEKNKLLPQKEKISIPRKGQGRYDVKQQKNQVTHTVAGHMTGDEKHVKKLKQFKNNIFNRKNATNITNKLPLDENEDLDLFFTPPTVLQVFNQQNIPSTTHSAQHFPPTTISPLSITNSSAVINFNPEAEKLNTSLSIPEPNPHSVKTTTYRPFSNINNTSDDSLKAQTETSFKPHSNDVTFTAMAAQAGKTVTSLPKSFSPKIQSLKRKMTKLHIKLKKKTMHDPKMQQRKKVKRKKHALPTKSHFPYFKDDYCPPQCNCYGRVVQCSDKELEKIPYGIPYNSHYIILMNNHIKVIPPGLFSEYLSMEFLVLSNNRLTDNSTEGAFEGIRVLKKLYMEQNFFQSVSVDLPVSLEELHLDGNRLKVLSKMVWSCCPRLLVLSLNNNSLESGSIPDGVFSPLISLHTLSLSYNSLSFIPQRLPLSLQEVYLRGNLIQNLQPGVFEGKAQLLVLDLSVNKLTNKGLGKDTFINVTHLESLNLEGNDLKKVPSHLPHSLRTLNLKGNSISSIGKATFLSLPNLEHLGLARNKIFKVVPGAFRVLPLLHQLDLSHNMLRQVPRQLPAWLVYIALNNNKIQTIPRDAFCSIQQTAARRNDLVKVQLENNLLNMAMLDNLTLNCLRGFQVVHFY